ncbi:hypothetical protein PFISCL1PPCAC_3704, partial [Pristionchus fissidentatus]
SCSKRNVRRRAQSVRLAAAAAGPFAVHIASRGRAAHELARRPQQLPPVHSLPKWASRATSTLQGQESHQRLQPLQGNRPENRNPSPEEAELGQPQVRDRAAEHGRRSVRLHPQRRPQSAGALAGDGSRRSSTRSHLGQGQHHQRQTRLRPCWWQVDQYARHHYVCS